MHDVIAADRDDYDLGIGNRLLLCVCQVLHGVKSGGRLLREIQKRLQNQKYKPIIC